jgi:hypothetical protein
MMNTPNRLDRAVDALKRLPVSQGPSAELKGATLALLESHAPASPTPPPSPRRNIGIYGAAGIAAALLVGLGFLGGRFLPAPPMSESQWEQLRHSLLASLEPALTERMQERLSDDWQEALVFTYAKLMNEVDQQVDDKLNRYAMQVLTVSHANTEQALRDLMALIRQNETRQQARITRALDQMEYKRLLSDSEFRDSLAHFVDVTQTHLEQTEKLMTYVAHEQGSERDPNTVKSLPKHY